MATTDSTPISFNAFNFAQTFYIDPSVVKNSSEVGLTKIALYFRSKPVQTKNKSGIDSPGVEIVLVPCINGVPTTTTMGTVKPTEATEHGARFAAGKMMVARKEWGEVQPSTDGTIPTYFSFEYPIFMKTSAEYAMLIKFDGNEDFTLWGNIKGDIIVNTTTPSPGTNGKNIGNLYQFINGTTLTGNATPTNTTTSQATINNPQNSTISNPELQDVNIFKNNWKALPDQDLRFEIYCARYSINNVLVAANTTLTSDPTVSGSHQTSPLLNSVVSTSDNGETITTLVAQSDRAEYILFDRKYSATKSLRYGEAVYQDMPYYPSNVIRNGIRDPLTVSVTAMGDTIVANGNYILANGSTFNSVGGFKTIFTENANDEEYIVIVSGNTVNVRKLNTIDSNTSIKIAPDQIPFAFTNSTAYFFKSPVGFISSVGATYAFGKSEDLLTLYDSNANATVRFTNTNINSVTALTAGQGYSNSFYLKIGGYEDINYSVKGGDFAYANIVTNSSGNIATIFVSNSGCGFNNTAWISGANVQVLNSSGLAVLTTIANGATFSYVVGSTLKAEFNNGVFGNTRVVNLEAMRVKPEITVNNPLGTTYAIRHRTLFTANNNAATSSGKAYYVNPAPVTTDNYVKIFKSSQISDLAIQPILPSRSNQFIIRYANGSSTNTDIIGTDYSNAAVLLFDLSSNSEFNAPFFDPDIVHTHYSKYIVNNDYSKEETNYGNAYAKHVTSKVNFSEGRMAEDILVYLTAYRPANTDLKVYARIHNSADPDSFDDKDWTLLEQIDGIGVYSSTTNPADFIEYTYNFTQYPNTSLTVPGSVAVKTGNDVITGTGTNFSNTIAANDLIKVYSPLFPNNYVICVVNNVISNTSLKIKRTLGDLSANLVGSVSVNTTSTNVVGSATTFTTNFSNGDYIAIWENSTSYEVRKINVVSNTISMNLDSALSFANTSSFYSRVEANTFTNNSVTGTGLLLDKLAYKYQAFNNRINDNVVRYYNSNMTEFDTYDTFQLKIIFLADNQYIVPKVDDIRAIGVSA